MKKTLSLLTLLAALMVPWVTSAQANCDNLPFPYEENFNSYTGNATATTAPTGYPNITLPACWTFLNMSSSTSTYPQVFLTSSTTYAVSGNCLFFKSSSSTPLYAIMPEVESSETRDYELTFTYRNEGTTASNGTLYVGVITDATSASSFVVLDSCVRTTTKTEKVVTIDNSLLTNGARVAFRYTGGTANNYYLSIDDVVLQLVPTCFRVDSLRVEPTIDEAVVSWIETGPATEWEVTVSNATGVVFSDVVADNSTTVTDLESNTPYTVKVRAVCDVDDTSLATYATFRTLCDAIDQLPWTFEPDSMSTTSSATDILCFDHIGGGYVNIATRTGFTGNTVRFYPNSSSAPNILVLPSFTEEISNLYLTLKMAPEGASSGSMDVGYITSVSDSTTFVAMTNYPVSFFNGSGSVVPATVDALFPDAPAGARIALRHNVNSTSWYWFVDELQVTALPECMRPDGYTVTDLTPNSATLNIISDHSSFLMIYNRVGSNHYDTVELSDDSYEFDGLEMGATYGGVIYTLCDGDTSMYGTPFSFTTACGTLTADDLPYTEDFEAYGTGSAQPINACWAKGTNSSTAYPYPYSTAAINGERGLYFYSTRASSATGTSYYSWAAMPAIDEDLDMNTLMVNFNAKRYGTTTAAYHSMIVVGVADSTTGFNSAEALDSLVTWIDTIDITSSAASSIHALEVSFENYEGEGKYVVFYAPYQNFVSGTQQYNYIYLDDIVLRAIPTCFWPSAVTFGTITATEAVVNWTPDARTTNPSGWEVEYGPLGFTPGTGTIETVTETTITLTELQPNTLYDVYIKADCGDDISDPATATFRTECVALDTLPYVQDFEDAETGTNTSASFVPCMKRLNNGTQYFGIPYVSGTSSYNHTPDGTNSLYWNAATTATTYGDYQCVVLPAVNSETYPVNTLQVRFWARSSSSTTNPVFQIGVMTNPNDINSFQLVETVNVGGNTTYTEYTVVLASYTGEGQYVAIKAVRPSTAWTAYVDDITLEVMPACPPITGIDAATTVGSALLNWTWQSGYEAPANYVVTYDSVGGTNPATVTVSTNSAILSGLEAGTTYNAYVQADCGDDGLGIMDSVTFTTGSYGCIYDPSNLIDVTVGNGTTTNSYIPSNSYYKYAYSQQFFTASEIGGSGQITKITLTPAAVTSQRTYEIYLGQSNDSSATAFVTPDGLTCVYNGGNIPLVAGQPVTFEFTTPFDYSDTSNLVVIFRDMTGSYTTGTTWYGHTAWTAASRYVYRDASAYDVPQTSGGTASTFRNNITFFGGVCIGQATCAAPAAMVTGATDNSVELAWAPGTNETSWNIDYRPVGESSWTSAATNVTTHTYTVTNLNDGTAYEFRVSFECNDADNTMYESIVSGATLCAPKALPYVQNFDNLSTSTVATENYGVMPMCWEYTLTGTSTYTTGTYLPGVYHGTAYAASGDYSLRLGGVGIFELPEMSAPLDSLRISFSDTITAASYNGLVIGMMENGSFVPYDTIDLSLGMRNYIEVLFRNYHGTSRTIALKTFNTSASTYYSYQYIDDLVVDYIPECSHVDNLTASDITDSSVTLGWQPVGESVAWMVVYGDDTVMANDAMITITGLTDNTSYTFDVYTLCGTGDTSEAASITVRTNCLPQSVPFFENFDSYTSLFVSTSSSMVGGMVPCWDYLPSAGGGYMTFVNSGTYLYGGSGLSLKFKPGTATSQDLAIMPPFTQPLSELELTFQTRPESTTSSPGSFDVGYIVNAADASTFVSMEHYDYSDFSGSYQEKTITFPGAPANARIAFRHNTASAAYYWFVDEIDVHEAPSCNRPMSVSVNNVTANSATVHIVDTTNVLHYRLYFNNGTTIDSVEIFDTTYVATLQPSSLYTLQVRSICTDGDITSAVSTSFNTLCGQVSLPVFYDPNNYTTGSSSPLPNCWTRTNNATGTVNYYPYIYSSAANAHTGNNTLYYYFTTSSGYANEETMAFPEIDVTTFPMNGVEVIFWAKSSVANKPFLVGVMTNPNDPTTFEMVDSLVLTTTVSEYTVSFANYTGTGTYVALRGEMAGTSSYYIYVDDINIGILSPCPRAYNLEAYDATTTSVNLEWTDTIGSNQWMVEYGLLNDTVTYYVTANSNPFVLTGLTPNTNYRYHVAPMCSNGQQADWSRTWKNFSTALNPATVPYSYDFEDAAEWGNWQTNSNSTVNWYRGNVAQGNTTNAMYISADNGATHGWNMSIVTNAVAYRDIDFGTVEGAFQIDFDAYIGGTVAHNYDGISVVVADPATYVEASSTGITSPWGHVNTVGLGTVRHDTTWGHHTIYIEGVSGVKRVAFYHFNQATGSNNTYENNPSAVDNVSITAQVCARPYDLTVLNATTSSATLGWNGDATALYEIVYREQGAAVSTNVSDTVTGTTYTVSGLPPAKNYYWWVRKVCSLTATDTVVSGYGNMGTFSTLCAVVSVADTLFEDFESYTPAAYNSTTGNLPNCWESWTSNNGTVTPHVTDSAIYSYCHSGRQAITMTSAGSNSLYGPNSYLRLVDIAEPTNSLTVAFWMCTESSTAGELSVGYLTGDNYETDFVAVKTIAPSTASTHSGNGLQDSLHGIFDTVSFDSVPAGNFPICFRWFKESTFYSVCLDDIAVWSSIVACNAPAVSVAPTETTAVVTIAGSASSYEVAYTTDTWSDDLTGVTVYDTSYTLTGLAASTNYTVGVRSLCGASTVSDWTIVTFTTDAHPCYNPSNVVISDTTLSGATISWTPGESIQTTFEVRVYNNTFDTTYIVQGTTFEATGLYRATTYNVTVRAVCGENNYSDWTTAVQFTTADCVAPTGVTVTAEGRVVTVRWQSTGADRYRVIYFDENTSADEATVVEVGNGATTTTVTVPEGDMTYSFFVFSYCGDVMSTASDEATVDILGIGTVSVSEVTLYPNPASTTVTIGGIEGESTVTVVDMNGRTVYTATATSDLTIDLSGMAKGAYFVRITGEQATAVRKLIVK